MLDRQRGFARRRAIVLAASLVLACVVGVAGFEYLSVPRLPPPEVSVSDYGCSVLNSTSGTVSTNGSSLSTSAVLQLGADTSNRVYVNASAPASLQVDSCTYEFKHVVTPAQNGDREDYSYILELNLSLADSAQSASLVGKSVTLWGGGLTNLAPIGESFATNQAFLDSQPVASHWGPAKITLELPSIALKAGATASPLRLIVNSTTTTVP